MKMDPFWVHAQMTPREDIIHLTQILYGHEAPLNSMLGKTLAKGLYAHFVLWVDVNWDGFVDLKHKNQILKALRDRKPKPDGPPIVRVDRVYKPQRVHEIE